MAEKRRTIENVVSYQNVDAVVRSLVILTEDERLRISDTLRYLTEVVGETVCCD